MDSVKDLLLPCSRLTEGEHQFFGYYDVAAFSGDDTRHLVHRVRFADRLPRPEDVAEIAVIRLADRSYRRLGETRAWNFQQGAMLQWNPAAPDREILFNVIDGDVLRGAVQNVETGERRLLERPMAAVDPHGRWALSINFSRMFDFRPGYGYAAPHDPFAAEMHPREDGIFRIDLQTGATERILSLRQIADASPGFVRGHKLVVNHITFNTEGTRFLFLPRTFGVWKTGLFSAARDGSGLYAWRSYGMFSHYHWRDREHALFWCNPGGGANDGLYLLRDGTPQSAALDAAFFKADGHCSYSPDRRWLLYDSYPVDQYRSLYLYDLERKKAVVLGRFFGPQRPDVTDIRCDLHPRWNRAGTMISFDSIHEGFRAVYTIDIRPLTEEQTC